MLLIVWEAKRPINLLHFSMNRKFHKIISQQRIGHIQIYCNALLDSCLFFQYFGYLKYERIVYREMSQSEPISSCQCRPIDLKAESLLPTNKKPLHLLRPVSSYFKSCFGWTELHTRLKFRCRTGKRPRNRQRLDVGSGDGVGTPTDYHNALWESPCDVNTTIQLTLQPTVDLHVYRFYPSWFLSKGSPAAELISWSA